MKRIIITFVCLLLASVVEGTDYYVDGVNGTDDSLYGLGPGTDAWRSIQYAIDNIAGNPGDVINIAAGNYTENTRPSVVHFDSTQSNKTYYLNGSGQGLTVVEALSATGAAIRIASTMANGSVILEGMTLICPNENLKYPVRISSGSSNVTVRDCSLEGTDYGQAVYAEDAAGATRDITIQDSILSGKEGVFVRKADDVIVGGQDNGNTIIVDTADVIDMAGDINSIGFSHNTVESTSYGAYLCKLNNITNCSSVIVSNNTVSGIKNGIISQGGIDELSVENNTMQVGNDSTNGTFVYVRSSIESINVSGNTITQTSFGNHFPIDIRAINNCEKVLLTNNTFDGLNTPALISGDIKYAVVTGNELTLEDYEVSGSFIHIGQVFPLPSIWNISHGTYDIDNCVINNNRNVYRCTQSHTSTSDNEPGISPGWETYWDLVRIEKAVIQDNSLINTGEADYNYFPKGLIVSYGVQNADVGYNRLHRVHRGITLHCNNGIAHHNLIYGNLPIYLQACFTPVVYNNTLRATRGQNNGYNHHYCITINTIDGIADPPSEPLPINAYVYNNILDGYQGDGSWQDDGIKGMPFNAYFDYNIYVASSHHQKNGDYVLTNLNSTFQHTVADLQSLWKSGAYNSLWVDNDSHGVKRNIIGYQSTDPYSEHYLKVSGSSFLKGKPSANGDNSYVGAAFVIGDDENFWPLPLDFTDCWLLNCSEYDLNEDGIVNFYDYAFYLR
jgi:hypothetical protein